MIIEKKTVVFVCDVCEREEPFPGPDADADDIGVWPKDWWSFRDPERKPKVDINADVCAACVGMVAGSTFEVAARFREVTDTSKIKNNMLMKLLNAMFWERFGEFAATKSSCPNPRDEEWHPDTLNEIAKTLDGRSVTIRARANEEQRLFGSVGPEEIVDALKADYGVEILPSQVVLEKRIYELGVFDVSLSLDAEVDSSIKVWVVQEG